MKKPTSKEKQGGSKRKRYPKMTRKKTKFEEYLETETGAHGDDFETERKLAKRLKIKGGKLRGIDDGINDLFEGIPSVLDSSLNGGCGDDGDEDSNEKRKQQEKKKKRTKKKVSVAGDVVSPTEVRVEQELSVVPEAAAVQVYVAPHLSRKSREPKDSVEITHIRRRVRGLLNRLSESNVESITAEIAELFRSMSRSDGCQMIGEEVLSSCANGPRGSEQYASIFAAFIAGMACLIGIDFSAKLIASIALLFEEEYKKEDNLSLRNITLLLCYLYILGVCSSDLIYDFLSVLSKRLTELDVSTILTVLQCCGMKLRGDDPISMKELIMFIQNRAGELKVTSQSSEETKLNSKRMEFMLETICDIKNNKQRSKDEPGHLARIKKWLQKLRMDDILLRGLKWNKLLDPEKKGQWWFSGDITSRTDHVEEVSVKIDREITETQKFMQLAAAQRMNTDVRRAIFCIIISAEDYIDAFEKILRLDLSGKQDREIMRVLVECCLQEKIFNNYYAVLASRLCKHDKNHRFTLQYCLWDHFKELESMDLRRSMNLAKFVSAMVCSFTLSLSLLKAVELSNPKHLTPKRIMHFRMLFENIFGNTRAVVWNVFSRVATLPEREMLSQNFEFFLKQFVISSESEISFLKKFRIAMKAFENVSGIVV